MKIKKGYLLRRLADDWVVVPIGDTSLDFSRMMRVNETGVFIWEMLEVEREREDLVSAILEQYNMDRDTVEKNLNEFLQALYDRDILMP